MHLQREHDKNTFVKVRGLYSSMLAISDGHGSVLLLKAQRQVRT
jgi:hypothetical protein